MCLLNFYDNIRFEILRKQIDKSFIFCRFTFIVAVLAPFRVPLDLKSG